MMMARKHSNGNIGFFVTLALSGSEKCEVVVTSRSRYKIEATVKLPNNNRQNWAFLCSKAFVMVLNSRELPIRLDYQNAIEFLSIEELEMLDRFGHLIGLFNIPKNVDIKVVDEETSRAEYHRAYYQNVRKYRGGVNAD